jgi:hypothetical protein
MNTAFTTLDSALKLLEEVLAGEVLEKNKQGCLCVCKTYD